jgi:hypothetical protein
MKASSTKNFKEHYFLIFNHLLFWNIQEKETPLFLEDL